MLSLVANSIKTRLYTEFKNLQKFKDYIIPMFTENEYIGQNKEYTWKCVKCR